MICPSVQPHLPGVENIDCISIPEIPLPVFFSPFRFLFIPVFFSSMFTSFSYSVLFNFFVFSLSSFYDLTFFLNVICHLSLVFFLFSLQLSLLVCYSVCSDVLPRCFPIFPFSHTFISLFFLFLHLSLYLFLSCFSVLTHSPFHPFHSSFSFLSTFFTPLYLSISFSSIFYFFSHFPLFTLQFPVSSSSFVFLHLIDLFTFLSYFSPVDFFLIAAHHFYPTSFTLIFPSIIFSTFLSPVLFSSYSLFPRPW